MWHKFGKLCGTGGNVGGQLVEVMEGGMDVPIEFESTIVVCAEGKLKVGEKASTAGKGQLHATQFAKELMPIGGGNAVFTAHSGEEGQQPLCPMGR